MFFDAFIALAIATVASLIFCPIAAKLASSLRLVDQPDSHRKLHKAPIPLIGGLSLLPICFLVPLGIYFFRLRPANSVSYEDTTQIVGLGIAVCLLFIVGLLDDRFKVRGRQKLVGQVVAITVLIIFNYHFDKISIFDKEVSLGVFAILFVYAWMLGTTNSINLLDGADGFASTIGIVLSLAVAAMSAILGNTWDAVIAASLAGALIGFLRLNFPPAKVFLGDSGSMLIGFILGALAIRLTCKEATAYTFLGPVAILAIPFIDTVAAIIRRRLTGRSIYETDRGHLHHELKRKGISNRKMLFYVAVLCTVTAFGGVLSLVTQESEYAIISVVAVVIFLVVSRMFGFAEFRLLSGKIASASRSFLVINNNNRIQNNEVRIQGEGNWQVIWNELRNFAASNQIHRLTLDLNIPWLHESFHATLKQETGLDETDEQSTWWSEIPILVDDRIVGRIDILSNHTQDFPAYAVITRLVEKIDELRGEFVATLEACAASNQSTDNLMQTPASTVPMEEKSPA